MPISGSPHFIGFFSTPPPRWKSVTVMTDCERASADTSLFTSSTNLASPLPSPHFSSLSLTHTLLLFLPRSPGCWQAILSEPKFKTQLCLGTPTGIAEVLRKAPAQWLTEKCVSGVIDVMCFIFLIIPHTAETLERWLAGCTDFLDVGVFVQCRQLWQLTGALLSESDRRVDWRSADGGFVGSYFVLQWPGTPWPAYRVGLWCTDTKIYSCKSVLMRSDFFWVKEICAVHTKYDSARMLV